jgi:hypothetical protein
MVVIFLDIWILSTHLLERSPPQVMADRKDVGLGDERKLLALGVVAFAGKFERIADGPLAAAAGVDGHLRGDFMRRAFMHEPASAAVQILGVLADHDEVDVVGALVLERRLDAGEKLHRPEIDVLVQAEAHVQQQLALEDAGGNVRMAHCAKQNGVETAELVQAVLRQRFAGFQITIAAPIQVGQLKLDPLQLSDRIENFDAFRGDFRPRSIAPDDGDLSCTTHVISKPFTCLDRADSPQRHDERNVCLSRASCSSCRCGSNWKYIR